jgi:hypothetical protein
MIPRLQAQLCSTVQYSSVQFSTVQYSSVQYSTGTGTTVLYCAVQYSTVFSSMVQSVLCTEQSSTQLCTAQRASVNLKRCTSTLYAVISKLYYSSYCTLYQFTVYHVPKIVKYVRFTNMQKMRFANYYCSY